MLIEKLKEQTQSINDTIKFVFNPKLDQKFWFNVQTDYSFP